MWLSSSCKTGKDAGVSAQHHEFPGQAQLVSQLGDAPIGEVVFACDLSGRIAASQVERHLAVAPRQRDGSNAMLEYITGEHVIRRNVLAFNQQWQLAFWGDNPFFGPHPSPAADQGKPPIDPEKLHLTIDSNLYFALPKQSLILYGPTWRPKHEKFTNLAAWQQSHPFDRHSVFADPQLVAPSKGDFRLRRSSPAYRLKAVPENMPVGMSKSRSR